MSEATPQPEIPYGGYGPKLHRHVPLLSKIFAALVAQGKIPDVANTEQEIQRAWRRVRTDEDARQQFAEQALKAVEDGVISLDGTSVADAGVVESADGAFLNARNVQARVLGACEATAQKIHDLLNEGFAEAIDEDVVWEGSGPAEDEKYNRARLEQLMDNNWRFTVEVNKRGAHQSYSKDLHNIDPAVLAEAFNKDNPWEQLKGEWIDGGDGDLGSRYEFTRIIRLRDHDGKKLRIIWVGNHGNPTNNRKVGNFSVNDTLDVEYDADEEAHPA